jgi:NADPH:quinone reductase
MTGINLPVFMARPDLIRDGLAFLVNHSNDGTVRVNVSVVLALSQAAEAHRLIEERQGVGAVVLDPWRLRNG